MSDIPQESPRLYTSAAGAWMWKVGSKINGHNAEAYHDIGRLLSLTRLDRGDHVRILGPGCGTGVFEMAALNMLPNAEVTAVDMNAAMIGRFEADARAKFPDRKVSTMVGDVRTELKQLRDPFDVIITSGLLEHLDPDALRTFLGECHRLLRPGGHHLDAAVRDTRVGRLIARLCSAGPVRPAAEAIQAFDEAGLSHVTTERLPWRPPHTYNRFVKEMRLFEKPKTPPTPTSPS